MKLKPLHQFICDECGEVIHKVEDGWLEWLETAGKNLHSFRIVHAAGASPRAGDGENCYYPESAVVSDNHLKHYTGTDGLALLLAFFDRRLLYIGEFRNIIRRIHIPHYEQARKYLNEALADGCIDSLDCTQQDLERVLEQYDKE